MKPNFIFHGTNVKLNKGDFIRPHNVCNVCAVFATPDFMLSALYSLLKLSDCFDSRLGGRIFDKEKIFIVHDGWEWNKKTGYVYKLDSKDFKYLSPERTWELICKSPVEVDKTIEINPIILQKMGYIIFIAKPDEMIKLRLEPDVSWAKIKRRVEKLNLGQR